MEGTALNSQNKLRKDRNERKRLRTRTLMTLQQVQVLITFLTNIEPNNNFYYNCL